MNRNARTFFPKFSPLKYLACLRPLISSLLGLLLSLCSTVVTAASTTEVMLYNHSFTPSIQKMLQTTITRSLELTRAEYGDYNLSYFPGKLSDERNKSLLYEGRQAHLFFSSHTELPNATTAIINIEIPFLSNALGLRIFLMRNNNIETFNQVETLDDLRKFKAGIGHTWAEKTIFNAQKIPFEEALLISSLLPMLEKQRFDYLAISALDDTESMGLSKQSNIQAINNLMLYYPIPVRLYISGKYSKLAARLKMGLDRFIENGEANLLVKSVFSDNAVLQGDELVRLLVIPNPQYNEDENKQAFESFSKQFPKEFIMIHE